MPRNLDQEFESATRVARASTTPAVISRIEHSQVNIGVDLLYRIFKALGKKQVVLDIS